MEISWGWLLVRALSQLMPQLVGSRDAGYIPADTGPPVSVQTHRNVVMPLLRSQITGVNEVAELTAGANTPPS